MLAASRRRSLRIPQPPRNSPGPAESAISSSRSIITGLRLSWISIGTLVPFHGDDVASMPSLVARAPMPPITDSQQMNCLPVCGLTPPMLGLKKCDVAAITRSGTALASAPIATS